jgi:peptide/nickel transport system permease protein
VLAYIVRRLLYLIPTMLGAITLVFVLIRLAPGDPLTYVLGTFDTAISAEALLALRQQYGLDTPLIVQYLNYVLSVATGDLGVSIHRQIPVVGIIFSQLGHTVALALGGLFIAALIGIPLGILAALRRNTRLDYLLMTWAIVGISAPGFWIGILLIYVLGFRLALFPMFGAGRDDLMSTLHALILPSLAVGTRSMALLARITRSTVIEVLQQDYIRTAKAKGLPPWLITFRHTLRNAGIPIVTVLGFDLAVLLGGTVTIEIVFSRPGLGRLMVDSIFARDYPLVQGCILFFGLTVIVINLLVDVLYTFIDPRVTYE